MEIDIEQFRIRNENDTVRIRQNQAHFGLWCIMSSPMLIGMDLNNLTKTVYDIITNKDAINVNQNYLSNGGDEILYFNISEQFRQEYMKMKEGNNNQTQLFYKPMPKNIGDAAILYLNKNETLNYTVSLQFNQLPLTTDSTDALQCDCIDIWENKTYKATGLNNLILPTTSCKFMLLQNCEPN